MRKNGGERNTQISVCIITLNAERSLNACLESLNGFQDITVMDSGSTDKTRCIAEKFGVRWVEEPWLGFGPQKNKCLEYAVNDWILFVDADEQLSHALTIEIQNLNFTDPNQCFQVYRENYLVGQKIRFSKWGRDSVIRIFNRKKTRFHDLPVHESVIPTSCVTMLSSPMIHHPYPTQESLRRKTIRYGTIAHAHLREHGWRGEHVWVSRLRSIWAFCRPFIFYGGFLDGVAGFRIAVMGAKYTYIKYQGPSD